ncbi:MAG: double zinc ribbon domain-containing protein [Eubacteriales bacterium]
MMLTVNRSRGEDNGSKSNLTESRRKARLYYGFGVIPAKSIKVCSQCKTICKADENFCSDCGATLPEKNLYEFSVEDAKRCGYCNSILVGSEKFCPICGKNLRTNLCSEGTGRGNAPQH